MENIVRQYGTWLIIRFGQSVILLEPREQKVGTISNGHRFACVWWNSHFGIIQVTTTRKRLKLLSGDWTISPHPNPQIQRSPSDTIQRLIKVASKVQSHQFAGQHHLHVECSVNVCKTQQQLFSSCFIHLKAYSINSYQLIFRERLPSTQQRDTLKIDNSVVNFSHSFTLSIFWLKQCPNVNSFSCSGSLTFSKLRSKLDPNVKDWRPAGKFTALVVLAGWKSENYSSPLDSFISKSSLHQYPSDFDMDGCTNLLKTNRRPWTYVTHLQHGIKLVGSERWHV